MRVSGQILQPEVERDVVVGGLGVILLDYGENVEGKPASEREGELVKRRQRGQKHRRHDRVAKQEQRVIVRVVLVIVRRGVGAEAPHGTARESLSRLWLSEQRTRWDQKLQRGSDGAGLRATPAALRNSTGRVAEAETQERRQEDADRSGGATGELLTERHVVPR